MKLGFLGYTSLRSDLLAPRQGPNQYYSLLPLLEQLCGDKVHWIITKHLSPDCHLPLSTAGAEELRAHQCIYHYGDSFQPLTHWVNRMPAAGRNQLTWTEKFDTSLLKYGVPYLDAVIVEACGQIGGAWSIDMVLRHLYAVNPQIGIVLIDQDRTASTTLAKLKKWHPNYQHRMVVTTNYLARLRKLWSQVPTLSPHVRTLRMPVSMTGHGICYIGNDYQRRGEMAQMLGAPGFHLYGTMKKQDPTPAQIAGNDWKSISGDAFAQYLETLGCQYHGPTSQIEQTYHNYQAGICITREDGYEINYYASRPSEIARAGRLAFWDRRLAIGKPLGGEYCLVDNAAHALQKLAQLETMPDYWYQMVDYQWNALDHFTSSERYAEAFYRSAVHLAQGNSGVGFEFNPYRDLMAAAGIPDWGHN